jgi:hypothetical protein
MTTFKRKNHKNDHQGRRYPLIIIIFLQLLPQLIHRP